MRTQVAAATLTPKQRKCAHPYQHVHPTYDPRWETCDLCHIVRPAVPVAPWIEAHDAAAPAPEPPSLFAEQRPISVAVTNVPVIPRAVIPRAVAQTTAPEPKPTRAALRSLMIRDAQILGYGPEEPTPPLAPEQQQKCPRCAGKGRIADPAGRRRCPRCQGERVIARYSPSACSAAPVRPEDTAPHSASPASASPYRVA